MVCSNCGAENEADARFCNECGTAMSSACASCGTANRPGAKFCRGCGATLSASPTLAPVGAVGQMGTRSAGVRPGTAIAESPPGGPAVAERRLVSVLFADLVGFTPFAEERDAEAVRDTLSSYFAIATDVITRYGGTVEKFIGDAVMAVWGAPIAQEDDAERAVRAG